MKPITLEQYLNNPALDHQVYAQARRARALILGRLFKSLILWLRTEPRPAHWIARLG